METATSSGRYGLKGGGQSPALLEGNTELDFPQPRCLNTSVHAEWHSKSAAQASCTGSPDP